MEYIVVVIVAAPVATQAIPTQHTYKDDENELHRDKLPNKLAQISFAKARKHFLTSFLQLCLVNRPRSGSSQQ